MSSEQSFGLLARNASMEVWLVFLHIGNPDLVALSNVLGVSLGVSPHLSSSLHPILREAGEYGEVK